VSPSRQYLPAEQSFLDPVRVDARDPGAARAVVIPFGLEASVSYGGGTAQGPSAILKASQQLELYDDELGCEPYRAWGVAALPEPAIKAPIEAALAQLAQLVEGVLEEGKFPLVLGGEHSLTPGAIRPLASRHPDLVVLQLDGHADLRDAYLGERYSHAAAMRRVLELPHISLISVGIRAISTEEVEFYTANRDRITIHWAKDQAHWDVGEIVAPLAGRPVYITFDIDALDSAVMPATGTPTPGGLGFWQVLRLLRCACATAGRIVGADLVEFAPIPGLHACDYTAAALAYKLLAYALDDRSRATAQA
jgi:agmatinase